MDSKSLMIGDWVKLMNPKGECIYYAKIDANLFGIFLRDCEEGFVRFEPIPLTPEIFEKNGFTYNENLKRYEIRNPHIEVVVYQNEDNGEIYGFYVTYTNGSAIKCREYEMTDTRTPFAHELQHALRLCGLDGLADNFQI